MQTSHYPPGPTWHTIEPEASRSLVSCFIFRTRRKELFPSKGLEIRKKLQTKPSNSLHFFFPRSHLLLSFCLPLPLLPLLCFPSSLSSCLSLLSPPPPSTFSLLFQLQMPMDNLSEGSELTSEPFRWDQRLFTVLLRLPGVGGGGNSNDNNQQMSESSVSSMCEATGGVCVCVCLS